jgi:uncharacterized protein DUF6636
VPRLVSTVVVAAALGLPAVALAVPTPVVETGFRTPSGNIACNAGTYHGKKLLACTLFSKVLPDRGFKVWSMYVRGRALSGFVVGNPASDYPKLAYGRTWRWHGFSCKSERRGLTCRNRAAHGFFLSRGSQRVF